MASMDIIKLVASVFLGIAIQTATLFVFHKIRGPFKELGILQKDIMAIQHKIEDRNRTRVRYVKKTYHKPKTLKPKIRSRPSQDPPLGQSEFKQKRVHLQHGLSIVQAGMSANDSNALKTEIQNLLKLCHDLDAKMRLFRRKMFSNQLFTKKYVKRTQADQDKLREEVGNIFISLEDEMSLMNDNIEIRLSNVESRVLALIEAKLKADRRKGWYGKSICIS